MSAVLRFALLVLWASYACGHWDQSTRRRTVNGHYYRPHARTYNHNYPTYNHHQPTPHRSLCSAETPCHQQMLTYTRDVYPDAPPNPGALIYHYKRAGFDKYAIIEEGKRAAKFFHHQYGVDVGYLPDEAYLAPNITLASGMRFSIISIAGKILNVASQRDQVEFINAPISAAGWILSFPADYYSNGAFKGHIPAGSHSSFGSYIFDVCPDESPYNPCRSTLSSQPKGQVFIKCRSRTFTTPGVVDYDMVHAEWGPGHAIGAFVTTAADGIVHERAILTFPRSCHYSVKSHCKTWNF